MSTPTGREGQTTHHAPRPRPHAGQMRGLRGAYSTRTGHATTQNNSTSSQRTCTHTPKDTPKQRAEAPAPQDKATGNANATPTGHAPTVAKTPRP